MAEKGPPVPTPKSKKKFPVAGHTTKKGNTSLNPRVVLTPIDHNQGQNVLNPPNQPVNLPEQLQNNPNQLPPPLIPAIYQTNRTCQTNKTSQINRICQTYQINKIHLIYYIYPIP